MKRSFITVTDQFCGAGGSSLGAKALGLEVQLAMNHWNVAVETHNTNFPETHHDIADISAVSPHRYWATDILITSPECTNHTQAKGVKRHRYKRDLFGKQLLDPAAERSRATMWDVPRFAEVHNYNLIIVENVVEIAKWRLWDAWIHAMRSLDYEYQTVYFNSMFAHPTPQSRDRIYVVFWKRGNKAPDLDIRPKAYCVNCRQDVEAVQSWKKPHFRWGRYRRQYLYRCPTCAGAVTPYYYAAANAIDWALPIQRIGDRANPLKPKTIARIKAGLEKFGTPYIVRFKGDVQSSPKSVYAPIPALTTSGSPGIVQPFVVDTAYSGGNRVSSMCAPLPTQTGRQTYGVVQPYIVELRGASTVRSIYDALSTVATSGAHHALVQPRRVTGGDDEATLTEIRAGLTVEDLYFRMLQPHEIGRAMAFPDSYIVTGNKRQKVRQYGNAVTPPVMEMILRRCVDAL